MKKKPLQKLVYKPDISGVQFKLKMNIAKMMNEQKMHTSQKNKMYGRFCKRYRRHIFKGLITFLLEEMRSMSKKF